MTGLSKLLPHWPFKHLRYRIANVHTHPSEHIHACVWTRPSTIQMVYALKKKNCYYYFLKINTQMAMRSNSWESWKVCDPIIKTPQSVHIWLIGKAISAQERITLHICADIMKSQSIVIKILIRCFNIFSKKPRRRLSVDVSIDWLQRRLLNFHTTSCSTLLSRWYLSGHVN